MKRIKQIKTSNLKYHLLVMPILLALPLGLIIEVAFEGSGHFNNIVIGYTLFYLIYLLVMIVLMNREFVRRDNNESIDSV